MPIVRKPKSQTRDYRVNYNKRYYAEHREKWNKYRNKWVMCTTCNLFVRKGSVYKHATTRSHATAARTKTPPLSIQQAHDDLCTKLDAVKNLMQNPQIMQL